MKNKLGKTRGKMKRSNVAANAARFSKRFTDNPNLKFRDISDEAYRYYTYSGLATIVIRNPVALAVMASSMVHDIGSHDAHRIVDVNGVTHYISAGWLTVSWKNKSGKACKF